MSDPIVQRQAQQTESSGGSHKRFTGFMISFTAFSQSGISSPNRAQAIRKMQILSHE